MQQRWDDGGSKQTTKRLQRTNANATKTNRMISTHYWTAVPPAAADPSSASSSAMLEGQQQRRFVVLLSCCLRVFGKRFIFPLSSWVETLHVPSPTRFQVAYLTSKILNYREKKKRGFCLHKTPVRQ
jgi:hypothetical protein